MTRRAQHASAWIFVNVLFAISGGLGLFVGVRNARCELPDLFDSENGPFGRAADDGVDHQLLFDIARWSLIGGMAAATAATVFGMVVSWSDRIRLRTLLTLMGLAFLQFMVALVVLTVQIESNAFCGADLATIATAAAIAILLALTIGFTLVKSRWSSADIAEDADATDIADTAAPTTASATARMPASSGATHTVDGPYIIQLAGHGGAGKSTLARQLAQHLDAITLDLDVIKSSLLDAGASWDVASTGSYATIYALVDELLAQRPAIVIVDTPSYWAEIHQQLCAAAERHDAEYAFIECTASDDTRAERIAARTPARSQVAEAGGSPADAPEHVGDVHDRAIERPVGCRCITINTEHEVEIAAVAAQLS